MSTLLYASPEPSHSKMVSNSSTFMINLTLIISHLNNYWKGVKLTKARGEAMQAAADATSSGMVAVIGLDIPAVQKICDDAAAASGKPISIANYLVDGNYAISGAKEACDAAKEIAVTAGARMAVPLAVAGAFHTGILHDFPQRIK